MKHGTVEAGRQTRLLGWNAAWGGVLGVALLGGAGFWAETLEPPVAGSPTLNHHHPEHPDEADRKKALGLLKRANEEYQKLTDYRCEMRKRERLQGKLGAEHAVSLTVKCEPFMVHMAWREPRSYSGQEVLYVHPESQGKMRAKAAGLLGNIGFVTLSLDDPKARATSRHGIDEAGFGNLLRRLTRSWNTWEDQYFTTVRVSQTEIDGKTCETVDVVQGWDTREENEFARTIISFAADTGFPVRIDLFGWNEDDEVGELMETYLYSRLELNPCVPEEFFKR